MSEDVPVQQESGTVEVEQRGDRRSHRFVQRPHGGDRPAGGHAAPATQKGHTGKCSGSGRTCLSESSPGATFLYSKSRA